MDPGEGKRIRGRDFSLSLSLSLSPPPPLLVNSIEKEERRGGERLVVYRNFITKRNCWRRRRPFCRIRFKSRENLVVVGTARLVDRALDK